MSNTFLAVGAPCGGSHYVKYILNQMGVECTLETPTPGKSLVMWGYATGYDPFDHHGYKQKPPCTNVSQTNAGDFYIKTKNPPPDVLYDDNYNTARETYSHIIHYTRNPFHSVPCLSHELGGTSFETYLRNTVISCVRDKKPKFWYTPWHLVGETNNDCSLVDYVLDFLYKWHLNIPCLYLPLGI